MKPDAAALLRRLSRGRSRTELKALFAHIRAHDDRALLAKSAKAKRKKPSDSLVGDLNLALRPLLAPGAEKAELLAEHLDGRRKHKLNLSPRGLADAVRLLRPHFTDAQIRAGAKGLMKKLNALYSRRETVV